MFRLGKLLRRWTRQAPLRHRRRVEIVDETPRDDPPQGCGWFDSSHELQHGLLVTEHASADAVANDLPLASWFELRFGAWPATDETLPQPA